MLLKTLPRYSKQEILVTQSNNFNRLRGPILTHSLQNKISPCCSPDMVTFECEEIHVLFPMTQEQ